LASRALGDQESEEHTLARGASSIGGVPVNLISFISSITSAVDSFRKISRSRCPRTGSLGLT
jgi:hypothetical protein